MGGVEVVVAAGDELFGLGGFGGFLGFLGGCGDERLASEAR